MYYRATVIGFLGVLVLLQLESSVRDIHDKAVLLDRVTAPTYVVTPPAQRRTRLVPRFARSESPDTIITDVNRDELFRQLGEPEFLGSARFVPTSRHGRAVGIKIYAIQPGSMIHALGFRNGDTLLSINDLPVTSPDAAIRIYDGREDSPDFLDITVRRNGRQIRIVALLHG